jgi:hypothetical protein
MLSPVQVSECASRRERVLVARRWSQPGGVWKRWGQKGGVRDNKCNTIATRMTHSSAQASLWTRHQGRAVGCGGVLDALTDTRSARSREHSYNANDHQPTPCNVGMRTPLPSHSAGGPTLARARRSEVDVCAKGRHAFGCRRALHLHTHTAHGQQARDRSQLICLLRQT